MDSWKLLHNNLFRDYVIDELSVKDLAVRYGMSCPTMRAMMEESKIPVRDMYEAHQSTWKDYEVATLIKLEMKEVEAN